MKYEYKVYTLNLDPSEECDNDATSILSGFAEEGWRIIQTAATPRDVSGGRFEDDRICSQFLTVILERPVE